MTAATAGTEPCRCPSDAERIAVLAAEDELETLRIIVAHAPLSDVALDFVDAALNTIEAALQARRFAVGLATAEARDAA